MARSLSTSPTPLPAPQIKPLSEALATLLEDSFEGARNEAAVCLGTLMKMVGERPLNALMDGLTDVRKAKVKEAYDNAKVKAKAGSGAPPKPAAPPAKEPPKKKVPPPPKQPPTTELPAVPSQDDSEPPPENKPIKKPPARLMVRFNALLGLYRQCFMCIRRRRPLVLEGKGALLRPQLPLPLRSSPMLPLPQLQSRARAVLRLLLVLLTPSSSSTRQRTRRHLLRKLYPRSMLPNWVTRTGRSG